MLGVVINILSVNAFLLAADAEEAVELVFVTVPDIFYLRFLDIKFCAARNNKIPQMYSLREIRLRDKSKCFFKIYCKNKDQWAKKKYISF